MQIKAAQEAHCKTCLYDDGNGKIDIVGIDEAHSASSESGKGPMHGALPQHLAVDAVIGGGGNGPDHVGRINVLDVNPLHTQARLQYLASPSNQIEWDLKPLPCKAHNTLKPSTLPPCDLCRIRIKPLRHARDLLTLQLQNLIRLEAGTLQDVESVLYISDTHTDCPWTARSCADTQMCWVLAEHLGLLLEACGGHYRWGSVSSPYACMVTNLMLACVKVCSQA